jgi:2-amino-4-hydroxy-6-hydroxymethyldihydropteridine diphosphokinase
VARAYLGLGSNLGDRRAMLVQAIEALDWGAVRVVARSSVYETDPFGGPRDQPAFYNQVVVVETTLDPRKLFERCLSVERALGRAREHEERWGPRAIDVDVLLYDDAVIDEPDLQIPHPRLHERAFVLVPLGELAPEANIPGLGAISRILLGVGEQGVRRVL